MFVVISTNLLHALKYIMSGGKITRESKKKAKLSSSNKSVATVSSNGKVKPQKAGKATITAKIGKKSYKCKVTVKKASKNTVKLVFYVGESNNSRR